MEPNPRDYGERCRFDAFCKTVLKHEAIDYIREMKRRASRETSLERLPQTAMDKLCSADDYSSDSYVSSYCGCYLPIRSQQVADAFASLPEQEQSIHAEAQSPRAHGMGPMTLKYTLNRSKHRFPSDPA